MKKSLGSLLLILFVTVTLKATPLCDYDFKISNTSPYVKESVMIIFEAVQKDRSGVMFFELTAKKSKDFELHFLGKKEIKKTYHDNKTTFRYLLFPLKEGKINLDFDFKVSLSSDESVEKFYTGNRDVINPMSAKTSIVDIEPLEFNVQNIKKDIDLIGDFHLDFSLDKKEINFYEQLNITYELSGYGYIANLKKLLPEISGVDQFLQAKKNSKSYLKNEKRVFNYAMFSDKDFEIPKIKINCFSPKKQKYYTLETPIKKIKVSSVNAANILDKKDSYPSSAFNWSDYLPYLNALLLFISGFIVAKLDLLKFINKGQNNKDQICEKIKNSKDKKALLQILLSSHEKRFKPMIKELESSIYGKQKCDLKKIKADCCLDQ